MAIKIGSIDINKILLGSTAINRVYQGGDIVHDGATFDPATESAIIGWWDASNPSNTTTTVDVDFIPSDVDTTNNVITLALPAGEFTRGLPYNAMQFTYTTDGDPIEPLENGGEYILEDLGDGTAKVFPLLRENDWDVLPSYIEGEQLDPYQAYGVDGGGIEFTTQGTGTHNFSTQPILTLYADRTANGINFAPSTTQLNSAYRLLTDPLGTKYIEKNGQTAHQGANNQDRYGKLYKDDKTSAQLSSLLVSKKYVGFVHVGKLRGNRRQNSIARAFLDSSDVNTGTGVFSATDHGFVTGKVVQLDALSDGGAFPTPTVAFGSEVYIKNIGDTGQSDTFTLHPTEADAIAGTNTYVYSDSGTGWFAVTDQSQVQTEASVRGMTYDIGVNGQNAHDISPVINSYTRVINGTSSHFFSGGGSGLLFEAFKNDRIGRNFTSLKVRVFVPSGTIAPTRLDTGLPLETGEYWISDESNSHAYLYNTQADAEARTNKITYDNTNADGEILLMTDDSFTFRQFNDGFADVNTILSKDEEYGVWAMFNEYEDGNVKYTSGFNSVNNLMTSFVSTDTTTELLDGGDITINMGNTNEPHVVSDMDEVATFLIATDDEPTAMMGELITWAQANYPVTLVEEKYHVFLLAGQSNAVGRNGPIDPILDATDPRIFQLQRTVGTLGDDVSMEDIILAADPLDNVDPNAGDIGFAMTFLKDYLATIPAHDKIIVVPTADGATNFDGEWSKGDPQYIDAINRTNVVMDMDNTEFKGILWHQGESEGALGVGEYADRLTSTVLGFREEIEGAYNAPLIAGQLQPGSGAANVQNDIINVGTYLPFSAGVSSAGLTTSDGTHFDAPSLRTLGNRYFTEYNTNVSGDLGLTQSGVPTIDSLIPTQTTIDVAITPGTLGGDTKVRDYWVYIRETGQDDFTFFADGIPSDSTTITIDGLTDATSYDVMIIQVTAGGSSFGAISTVETLEVPLPIRPPISGFLDGAILDITARNTDSYDGTQADIINLSTDVNKLPDFWNGSDGTVDGFELMFNGVGGDKDDYFSMDAVDNRFTSKSTDAFYDNLHRSDSTQDWTIAGQLTPDGTFQSIFATAQHDTTTGFILWLGGSSNAIRIRTYDGGTQDATFDTTTNWSNKTDPNRFVFTYNATTGAYSFKIHDDENGLSALETGTLPAGMFNTTASSTAPTIFNDIAGGFGLSTTAQFDDFVIFDRELPETEMDEVLTFFANTKGKAILPTLDSVTGMRHAFFPDQVIETYTGNTVRLSKDPFGAGDELDFGFTSDGYFDIAGVESWASSGEDIRVVSLYDQAGAATCDADGIIEFRTGGNYFRFGNDYDEATALLTRSQTEGSFGFNLNAAGSFKVSGTTIPLAATGLDVFQLMSMNTRKAKVPANDDDIAVPGNNDQEWIMAYGDGTNNYFRARFINSSFGTFARITTENGTTNTTAGNAIGGVHNFYQQYAGMVHNVTINDAEYIGNVLGGNEYTKAIPAEEIVDIQAGLLDDGFMLIGGFFSNATGDVSTSTRGNFVSGGFIMTDEMATASERWLTEEKMTAIANQHLLRDTHVIEAKFDEVVYMKDIDATATGGIRKVSGINNLLTLDFYDDGNTTTNFLVQDPASDITSVQIPDQDADNGYLATDSYFAGVTTGTIGAFWTPDLVFNTLSYVIAQDTQDGRGSAPLNQSLGLGRDHALPSFWCKPSKNKDDNLLTGSRRLKDGTSIGDDAGGSGANQAKGKYSRNTFHGRFDYTQPSGVVAGYNTEAAWRNTDPGITGDAQIDAPTGHDVEHNQSPTFDFNGKPLLQIATFESYGGYDRNETLANREPLFFTSRNKSYVGIPGTIVGGHTGDVAINEYATVCDSDDAARLQTGRFGSAAPEGHIHGFFFLEDRVLGLNDVNEIKVNLYKMFE